MLVSRRVEALAWALSLLLHGAVAGYVYWSTSAPELGFDFQLPTEVEFGLTEAVTVTEGPTAAAPEESSTPPDEGEGPGAADGGVPLRDGGPPDGGRRRRDAGPPDASAMVAAADEGEGAGDEGEGSGDEEGEGHGVAFLPAGSQIALRLDVARIRASPLADDVRGLLAVIPDWSALLEGSGIDPLEDLDRVLVATPNLQRSRLIVAGRAMQGAEQIRAATARLAETAGESAPWTIQRGVNVAPWHDRDPTERVIALVGPRHFIICRPVDLPRVLAVARNRAAEEGEHPADALLSMDEGAGLTLEVEGFRNFARANPRRRSPLEMLPTGARLAVSQLPEDQVAVRVRASYEDSDQADAAAPYWDQRREAYGRNLIVQVLGVAPLLSRATLETDAEHLDGSVDLSVSEMRRLLVVVRGLFQDRARARQQPPPSAPTPEPGAPAPTAPAPEPESPSP